MRRFLIAAALSLLVSPAWAQTQQQYHDWCYGTTSTSGQTIVGCTELIDSGQYSGNELAMIYTNRATGYNDAEDSALTIQDSNRAIQLDPTIPNSFNNLCHAYLNTGDWDNSISYCTKAIALKADYTQAFINRGFAYEKKGNRDQAIADFRVAVRLNPNAADAAKELKQLGAQP